MAAEKEERGGKKKKEKISSHPQMAARSNANVKRRRATAGAPAKREAHRGGTRRLCRWLYEQRDDGKPITNVSVSSYFRGQNNLCAESSCAPPFVQILPFFFFIAPVFVFAAIEYK